MSVLLSAASTAQSEPALLPMIVLGTIMVATYVVVAFEWMHKSIAAMVGAAAAVIAALAFGLFPVHDGERMAYTHVHHIIGHELGVIGVIIGTSILVDVASHSGLFHFVAVKIVKLTKGDPNRLFLYITLLTIFFVTFLTIAPGSLIVVSLALVVTKALDINPRPYVMSVAIVANSGALMTLASGICTLMLATASGLPYASFFKVTTPMAFISAAIAYYFIRRFYKEALVAPGTPEERARKVASFDEWALVKDRRVFFRSAIILVLTIIGFASAQTLGIGLDAVAMGGGLAALVFSGHDPEQAIKVVKWPVILFFVGLFVIIGAVDASQLLSQLAGGMVALSGGSQVVTMVIIAVFVLTVGGFIDNIPVAATLIPIVRTLEAQGLEIDPLWWTLIIAANLSGNATPVGSISSVIALSALEKERGIKIGWGEFMKVGMTILGVQCVVVVAYLLAFEYFGLFPTR
ncbi:MAG: transporter [Myxococcales bacterium]|nr:transporter [Myxococcales bacterium]